MSYAGQIGRTRRTPGAAVARARMPGWQVSPLPGAAARQIARSRRAVTIVQAPGKLRSLLSSSLGSLARGTVSPASRVRALNPLVLAGTHLRVAGWDSLGQPAPASEAKGEARR